MKFTATHTRALTGNNIAVTVDAGEKESIASVTIQLDGALIEEVELSDGTENYSRMFSGVGYAAPTMQHALIVTAVDAGGVAHSATTQWSDS